ncbi:MAG: PolC-type DNA polymerase III [Eubacterium sp.]|nr:PolC-type DNA polymerase III [Eubacterium sp.]
MESTKIQFFDAFTELDLDTRLYHVFSDMDVEKVVSSGTNHTAVIHLRSRSIISRKDIERVESALAEQIFNNSPYRPVVFVLFDVDEESTTKEIFDLYKDVWIEEIREHYPIDYHMFCNKGVEFEDDSTVLLTCDDEPVTRGRSAAMGKYMETCIRRRFGREIHVDFRFATPKKRSKKLPEYEFYVVDPNESGKTVEKKENDPNAVADSKPDNIEEDPEKKSEKNSEKKSGKKSKKEEKKSKRKNVTEPGLVYGRNVEGDISEISGLIDGMGEAVICGMVTKTELRDNLKNGLSILMFDITDFTDTIRCKLFLHDDEYNEFSLGEFIAKGHFLRVKGRIADDKFDHEIRMTDIRGIREAEDFRSPRIDTAEFKRVELHAHTQMSDTDAMTETSALVKCAHKWGHPAVAITDHGVVQSFPDAESACKDTGDDDFKVIYGCEIYLVDDTEETVFNEKGQSLKDSFVVFDLETTGFSPTRCKIIEIGAVKVVDGEIVDRFSTFVDPHMPIPPRIRELTKIEDNMVQGAPDIREILPDFMRFCEGSVLVAHNASFDHSFIRAKAAEMGAETDYTVVDTVGIARVLFPDMAKATLDAVAKKMKISLENHHRAVEDAEATAQIFVKMIPMLERRSVTDLHGLYELTYKAVEITKRRPVYHTIVLAANEVGRVNLYRLVSDSHLKYFQRRPRVPKSELTRLREGLIIGSACEAGELFQAILDDRDEDQIEEIASYYDYLEIQPVDNNAFMIESTKRESYERIHSFDDLRDINRRIVALGEKLDKPVCATCDVHFLNPEDEIYREILLAGKKITDEQQPPLYLRTTDEMLEEFSYLGEEKAFEVVVANTVDIADRIEKISPVYPYKCAPEIPDSDKMLREICYRKAHQMYGEELPEVVSERLERELNSIISNGFAVMYIIAQKLVWKSNEDGYLVGSRGSVGSSFVATMAGITEVNPLPAHYYCENCHYSDFDSEEVKSYSGSSGYDMPAKDCPVCGKPLMRDGHDIPFETFLGFKGDKEPDIDLNFSGEYQSKAHAYTEVIFGDGQTYRAGTVGTIADKTAYGYVKNFFDEKHIHKRPEEYDRLVEGVSGVKNSTGQHPGGIVVLPLGWDINVFTPVQHPANKDIPIITTHYDYHKIDSNLLKLDILGHDDPTMIRMLEDITGVDAQAIPLDDEKVLSLFEGTEALGIDSGELMGADLGCLGVPEMGTDFVMQMLKDTKPKNFSDLVRISGLSHGTDVWLNNAQYYIKKGDCTLSTAICTRDDIMTYLIYAGVENSLAFNIMEAVRKGKVAKGKVKEWPDWSKNMLDCGVPEWYIESCEKIKYMFPKAHAVAYVMMAFRIAWFKVYHPLAYYAAFFSIRAKAFDYELMCMGRHQLEQKYREYEKRSKSHEAKEKLSKKEEDSFGDMKIVQEMYARGFEFAPIDLEKVNAKLFTLTDDGRLMPSLMSINGVADSAAESIADAVKDGPFSSCKNFKDRTHVSQTTIDKLRELGILGNIPLDDQMSLLDLMQ